MQCYYDMYAYIHIYIFLTLSGLMMTLKGHRQEGGQEVRGGGQLSVFTLCPLLRQPEV